MFIKAVLEPELYSGSPEGFSVVLTPPPTSCDTLNISSEPHFLAFKRRGLERKTHICTC